MAPSKTRQRKLERAKLDRQLARRAQAQRRKRQIQAGVGAFLAIAVVSLGTLWLTGFFEPEEEPFVAEACTWVPQDTDANPELQEVGTPPGNPPDTGTRTMTIGTSAGTIEVAVDVAADPCAAANIEHLAGQGFYNDTVCHELITQGALRCGDPGGTGYGGPTYTFYAANLPYPEFPEDDADQDGADAEGEDAEGEDAEGEEDRTATVTYAKGTVALIAETPGNYGSQFIIFYEDYVTEIGTYPILGTVTSGLDVIEAIAAAGTASEESTAPATEVRIQTLSVINPDPEAADPAGDESDE